MTETCPIHYWAQQTPEHIAVEASAVRLSYRTLNRRVASLAQQLARQGLMPGMPLLVPTRGSLQGVLLAWACLRAGVVFCPLNPAFPVAQQQALARRMQVTRVCQPESDFAYSSELPTISLDYRAEADPGEPPVLYASQRSNTILTSGSSGPPKAVLHRVGNHLASARGSASLIPVDPDSGWLLSLPLFHVGGYAIAFRVFLAGGRLVLDDTTRPLAERLMQQPITHLSLVPTQLWRLLREGFDPRHTQLRELLLGGAAIPAPLVERLQRLGLTPKVSYGLSEMASQVCTGSPSAPGVVGQPLPGRQVRVVDGEIQVKGDTLFCGYLADGALDPAVNDEAGSPPVTGATSTTSRRSSSKGGSTTYSFPAVKTYSQRASSSGWSTTRAWPRRWWWPCRTRSGASAGGLHRAANRSALHKALAAWVREALPGFMVPDAWLPWPPQVALKPSRKQFAELARRQLADV